MLANHVKVAAKLSSAKGSVVFWFRRRSRSIRCVAIALNSSSEPIRDLHMRATITVSTSKANLGE